MPKVDKLIQLKSDETVVMVVREYGITKLPQLTIALLAYFTVVFFLFPLFRLGWWGVVVFASLLFVVVVYSVRGLVIWMNDLVIVTNQRIIDHQRHGLFSKTVREITWSQVVDIRYSQRGLWATLFHYGSVQLVLSQATDTLDLHHVYRPATIRDILAEYAPIIS